MQSGTLTVTGNNSTHIPLTGFVREVFARFKDDDDDRIPCNPHHHHHHDRLEYRLEHEDEDPRRHHEPGHHHHERQFILVIKWQVDSVREIDWWVVA